MHTTQWLLLLTVTILLICVIAMPAAARQAPSPAGSAWELEYLNGEPLPEDAEVTLRFNEDRIVGEGPVNRYFGAYEVDGEALTFSEIVSTRIGGPPHLMEIETAYFDTLRDIRAHRIADETLQMLDDAHAPRLTFRPADPTPDLVGTEWELKLLDGERPPEDAEVTLHFNDDRVSGRAAVNQYSGSYQVDGEALIFSEIVRTEMAGPQHLMEVEEAFTEALQETRSLRVMEGRLELIDQAGETRALLGLAREDMTDYEIIDPEAPVDLAEHQLWVPMRPIAEWLGAKVEWDSETRTATAVREGKEFSADTRNNVGRGGGIEWSTNYSMLRPSGLVYVPLDALVHSLGGRVIRQPDDHVLILEIEGRRGTLTAP